jgi:hypothetical protein
MKTTKPQIVTVLTPPLRAAYGIDEDTATVILTSVFSAVFGPVITLQLPNGDSLHTGCNILGLEPEGLPRYLPIVEHLMGPVYLEQVSKFELRGQFDEETLQTFCAVQGHHLATARQQLEAAVQNDLSSKPYPGGSDGDSAETHKARKTLGQQEAKTAEGIRATRPLVVTREIHVEAIETWPKLCLDRSLFVYGSAAHVLKDLGGAELKKRKRALQILTGGQVRDRVEYNAADTTMGLPICVTYFLSLPSPEQDGLYLPGLGADIESITTDGWALPPLEQTVASPSKLDLQNLGFISFMMNKLVQRVLRDWVKCCVSDEAWKIFHEKQLLIIERLKTAKHPILRRGMEMAPMNALKMATLWSYGNGATQVNAQTYEEVWEIVDRLLSRLELHLRGSQTPLEPILSPEARTMVDKLTSKGGSLTFRELARCYSKMSRARLDSLVAEACNAGLVQVEEQTIALVNPRCQQKGAVSAVNAVGEQKGCSPATPSQNYRIKDGQSEAN